VAFGTLAIFANFAEDEGAEIVPLLAVRFGVAFALLVIFIAARRGALVPAPRALLRLMALGGLGYAFESFLFFAALERAPAALVSLVFYSYPLWTAVLSLALGIERFRWNLVLALLLGTVGLMTIFSIPKGNATGMLLALSAAVAVAVYFVAAQAFTKGVDPEVSSTWTAAGATVTLTIAAVVVGGALPAASLPHGLGLGVVTALAFTGLYAAVKRIGSARTAISMMVEPVTTVVLAAWLLDEPITGRVLIGMILIVSALPILVAGSPDRGTVAADTV
jgi:drug/metabolite transporter (DMT)-like permease